MNPFDMAIVVIIAFCFIRGIFRGLIKELASIVGVLGGLYMAFSYFADLETLIKPWVPVDTYRNIISFAIIFVLVFLIIGIVGVILKYILNIAFLGWVDRICGAGFGLIKGGLLAAVLLIVLTTFLPNCTPTIKASLLAPHVNQLSESMAKLIPGDMKRQFVESMRECQKAWSQPILPAPTKPPQK
jgi:membrane protein required for colicin V production